jgi:hypothetical protein
MHSVVVSLLTVRTARRGGWDTLSLWCFMLVLGHEIQFVSETELNLPASLLIERNCHLDRSEAQWRDLLFQVLQEKPGRMADSPNG